MKRGEMERLRFDQTTRLEQDAKEPRKWFLLKKERLFGRRLVAGTAAPEFARHDFLRDSAGRQRYETAAVAEQGTRQTKYTKGAPAAAAAAVQRRLKPPAPQASTAGCSTARRRCAVRAPPASAGGRRRGTRAGAGWRRWTRWVPHPARAGPAALRPDARGAEEWSGRGHRQRRRPGGRVGAAAEAAL